MSLSGRLLDVVRRHGLWVTALLAVAVFFGLFLYGRPDAVVEALGTVPSWRLGAVVLLASAGYLIRFLKWEYYLRHLGIRVSPKRSLVVFFSGLMLVVTPGKAGEVWKAWFLKRLEGTEVSRTASVVGAERVTDVLALGAFGALGAFLYDRSLVVLASLAWLFVIGLAAIQWRQGCLWVLSRLKVLPVVGDIADQLRTFYESVYDLFRPKPLVVAFLLSCLAWGLEGLALWIVLESFVPNTGVVVALFVFGMGSVLGAVSLLPGGLGAAEGSMVALLVVFGYTQTAAVTATLVIRLGTLWYGALLGTTVFLTFRFLSELDGIALDGSSR